MGITHDNRSIALISIELWNSHLVLHAAVVGVPANQPVSSVIGTKGEEGAPHLWRRSQELLSPSWTVEDDLGSAYVPSNRTFGGVGALCIISQAFQPTAPDQASTLSVIAYEEGGPIGRVAIPLVGTS
jgi:hypothetical protein